jgi:hypothetical protein
MKNGAGVALAVAAGYLLGRRRKLRLAAVLALAGAASRLRKGEGGGLLQQGLKMLNSPELEEITGRLRGDLMEVGKAAATAATSNKINALSDRLHERAEGLRTPGVPPAAGGPEKTAEKPGGERADGQEPPGKPQRDQEQQGATQRNQEPPGERDQGASSAAPRGQAASSKAAPEPASEPEPASGREPPVRRAARARG